MHAPHISDTNFYKSNFSQESLFQFQSEAIKKAAEEEEKKLKALEKAEAKAQKAAKKAAKK